MAEQAQQAKSDESVESTSGRVAVPAKTGESSLVTEKGTTTIADTVVAKIAGIAAREVDGVHALGGTASRAVGVVRSVIPGASTNLSQGISVEIGEKQAAVDVDIVAEYGVAISDLADGIRNNIISAVEGLTGLSVVEVNIRVHDVHIPSEDEDDDDDAAPSEPRVR